MDATAGFPDFMPAIGHAVRMLAIGAGSALVLSIFLAGALAAYRMMMRSGEPAAAGSRGVLGACFVFGFLAFVVGYIMSLSRGPAVGDVAPAIVGFIGVVAIYLVKKENVDSVLAGSVVIVFSAMILYGSAIGAYGRELHLYARDVARYDLETLKWQARRELLINDFREVLGLPAIDFTRP